MQTITSFLEQIDKHIIHTMNDHSLIGVGVGIVHSGETVYAKGFGLANTEQNRPVTPDTVFRIASITKTFTAIGLMQLWEQGKFDLDHPINDYLEWYRVQHTFSSAPAVQFRHMLTHTSGIGELSSWRDIFRPMLGLAVKPGEEVPPLWEYYPDGVTPEIYPQVKYAYSNQAYAILGQLVENISGIPFATYMREHIFEPLGMDFTGIDMTEQMWKNAAQGYSWHRGQVVEVPYLDITLRGAGAASSSVHDMCRYMLALLKSGDENQTSLLKPETLDLMMSPHYQIDERLPAMGLSFHLDKRYNYRIAYHNGGWHGFSSSMILVPELDVGIIVLANKTSGMVPALLAHNLAQEMTVGLSDDVPPTQEEILETPHLWSEICGFYGPEEGVNTNLRVWASLGGEVEVFIKDNHLMLRSLVGPLRKGVRLVPVDPSDPLMFEISPDKTIMWSSDFAVPTLKVVFKRDRQGKINRMAAGVDIFYKRPLSRSVQGRVLAGLGGFSLLGAIGLKHLLQKIRRR